MIVSCNQIKVRGPAISASLYRYVEECSRSWLSNGLPLKEGKSYVVYALVLGPLTPWVYIQDETGVVYPNAYPVVFFDTVDHSISRFWELGRFVDWRGESYGLLAFNEWANDPLFHGRLFEGEEREINLFDGYRSKMEAEFPLPWVKETPEIVSGDGWVYCARSNSSWRIDTGSNYGMVKNPETGELVRNPFYGASKKAT